MRSKSREIILLLILSLIVSLVGSAGLNLSTSGRNKLDILAPSALSENFGNPHDAPQGWCCASYENTNGLNGSEEKIVNGEAITDLAVPHVGSDRQYYYSSTIAGYFPFNNPPCYPATNVDVPQTSLPISNVSEINATFNLNSFRAGNSSDWLYHIYIDLYMYLPDGPLTFHGVTHQCLEAMSAVEDVNNIFSPLGTNYTCLCTGTFTWFIVSLPSVKVGGTYTIQSIVSNMAEGDLAAFGFPTSTPYELAGIEIGVEGYQFESLSVSWSSLSIASIGNNSNTTTSTTTSSNSSSNVTSSSSISSYRSTTTTLSSTISTTATTSNKTTDGNGTTSEGTYSQSSWLEIPNATTSQTANPPTRSLKILHLPQVSQSNDNNAVDAQVFTLPVPWIVASLLGLGGAILIVGLYLSKRGLGSKI